MYCKQCGSEQRKREPRRLLFGGTLRFGLALGGLVTNGRTGFPVGTFAFGLGFCARFTRFALGDRSARWLLASHRSL